MKVMAVEIEDKVDELLLVLDTDIRHIKKSLLRLDELRSLVIKRDDTALGRLLEELRTEADSCSANELKRQSIRKDLAVDLDCSHGRMTLSRLEDVLTGEKKTQIGQRKTELRALTRELKKEYLATAMLLVDCARFNSALLNSVFNLGSTAAVYYSSNGSKKRPAGASFVNLQF